MSSLLELRDNLRNIYSKYEAYILPALKFLLACIVLTLLNTKLGYMTKLDSFLIVLVLSLVLCIMPLNLLVVVAAIFMTAHMYAVCLEAAVVGGAVLLLMFLLYYRFAPKDALIVLFLPILFSLKIPILVPILAGLLCGPVACVSVSCGVIVYYIMDYIKVNAMTISALSTENVVNRFKYIMDGIFQNKAIFVYIAAFCLTTIVVYLIRRLSMDHAWTIAIGVGIVLCVVMLLIGDLKFDLGISFLPLIIGSILAAAICKVVQFFVFNVDYTRTEHVQFEDDEYYYYVKEIPKNTVSKAKHTVKKITSVI